MNLHRLLVERAQAGQPIRVGIIGAGKFASMFLAQALHTRGIHIMAVCDIEVARARATLDRLDWPQGQAGAASFSRAVRDGTT